MQTLKVLAIALLLISFAGCSTMKSAVLPSSKLNASITTSSDLNPNSDGRPSPLVLTIFQLSSDKIFNSSEFSPLYLQPEKKLDKTFVTLKKIQLLPDKTYQLHWPINKETKYIGVIAAYSNLNNAKWRTVIKLDSDWGKTKIKLLVDKDNINLLRK